LFLHLPRDIAAQHGIEPQRRTGYGAAEPAQQVGAAGQWLPCRQAPELFFADEPGGIARAKSMCAGCQARAVCLDGALQRSEPWGVWGGELVLNGVVVGAKRRHGRPRKPVIARS
jgi:WhiB family transcriptional regulator, redox-sensing transcriptional regulator